MTTATLESLRRRAESNLREDPRVRSWRVKGDGAIALEIILKGAVSHHDRFQIIEMFGHPLYRIQRAEGALDSLLDDLVLVRVDSDDKGPQNLETAPEEYLGRLNCRFWVDIWVAYGFLKCGKPWKVLKQLADLREVIFDTGRLATGDPELRDEEVVPEALRGALALTSCRPDLAEIRKALLFVVFVYRRIRAGAEQRLRVSFSEEVEQRLIGHLVERFKED